MQIKEFKDKIWELKEQKIRMLVAPRHQKLQKTIIILKGGNAHVRPQSSALLQHGGFIMPGSLLDI